MLAIQRHKEILALIEQSGGLRTSELSASLRVTDETIRRDLEKLELDGKLVRTHGGATRIKKDRRELPFNEREAVRVADKKALAQLAVSKLEPGDTIFLDPSSTVLNLAQILPQMPLTVISNAFNVHTELALRKEFKLISVGGLWDPQSLAFVGPLAQYVLKHYHINKYFFSCRGIDLQRGLSEANEVQADLKKRLIELSDESYLLADSSKFSISSSFYYADLSEVDVVIASQDIAASMVEQIESLGPQVEIASS